MGVYTLNEDHLNRLRSMAEKYGDLLAKQKGVLGVVISGTRLLQ